MDVDLKRAQEPAEQIPHIVCQKHIKRPMARFLATIAKLSRSFARLFRITFLSKSLKGTALVVVGKGIAGINEKGLVTGDKSFLIPLEVDKSNTFARVGRGIAGIKVEGLIVSGKGFSVPLEGARAWPSASHSSFVFRGGGNGPSSSVISLSMGMEAIGLPHLFMSVMCIVPIMACLAAVSRNFAGP